MNRQCAVRFLNIFLKIYCLQVPVPDAELTLDQPHAWTGLHLLFYSYASYTGPVRTAFLADRRSVRRQWKRTAAESDLSNWLITMKPKGELLNHNRCRVYNRPRRVFLLKLISGVCVRVCSAWQCVCVSVCVCAYVTVCVCVCVCVYECMCCQRKGQWLLRSGGLVG